MPFLAPAISAIGSAFAAGGVFAAGGALSIVGRLLVTVAISALGRAMADKPRAPGIRNERTQSGGVNPATFILGRYATGGTAVCPEMSYGLLTSAGAQPKTPNEFLVYVIDLGDIPGGTGLEEVIIDGTTVVLGSVAEDLPEIPIEGGGTIAAVSKGLPGTGKYAGKLWVKYKDGTDTVADPYLRRVFGNYPERPWTADMIGTGVPHVILTFRRDPSLFGSFPQCRFVVGGIPLYDWRKDGSVGGVGPHRWNNRSTWEPSENPIVQIYNIQRGITLEGGFVWGGRAPVSALRLAEWTVEANKCDAAIALAGGGSEPAFRAGLEVSVFDEPATIVEDLLRGTTGAVAEVGGVWRSRIGAPALPVWSFSDDDVIITSAQDLSPFPPLGNTYNAVTATFPDPAMGWEPSEAPARYNAAWEALDQDRRLPADLNLTATPYEKQVQRVMRAYIEGERRFAAHILTLPPDASNLEPLDTVSWTSTVNGYLGKLFEVTEIAHDVLGGNVQVSLREVDPTDHDWVSGFELPFNRPSSVIVARPPAQVGSAAASGVALTDGASAARRPAIRIVWEAPAAGMFRGLEWELRVNGAVDVRTGSTQAIAAGEAFIAEGILPATDYQIRFRWIANQEAAWTPWLAVTTPDVRIGAADIDDALAAVLVPDNVPPADPTGLTASTSIVADGRGLLVATWTAPADTDLDGYEVRIRIGTGNFVNVPVYSPRFEANIIPTQTYSVQVRAFDTSGNRSGYTALINGTAVADTTPPAVPTGLSITAGYQLLWLKWTPNTETDLHHYEILEQSAATPAPTLATAATFSASGDQMARSGLPDAATRHYWIRAVDTSGNKSAWSARVQGTTATGAGVDPVALAGVLAASDGIVPSNALAAGSVVTSKLAVTDFENLIPDGVFAQKDLALVAATGGATIAFEDIIWASAGTALRWQRPAATGIASDIKQATEYQTPVEAGKTYAFEISARARSAGKGIDMIPRVLFYGSDGLSTGIVSLPQVAFGTAFAAYASQIAAPAGSAFAVWSLLTNNTAAEVDVQVQFVRLRRAGMGLLIVDGEIQANHLTTGELITASAQIKDAIITDAKIATLSAGKLIAGTALAGSITVSGTPLSTMKTVTDNPAAKVNSAATKIDPGKILISGATNLNDWQGLNDTTSINGGKIETNSITTKSLKVGDFSNMIPNGAFEAGLDGWTVTASQTLATLGMAGKPAKYALSIPANGTFNQAVWGNSGNLTLNSGFPMNGGDQFYCGAWVYRSAANTTGNLTINMQVGNGDDTVYLFPIFFTANTANATADTWVWMEGTVTIPDTVNAKLVTRGTLLVGTGSAATNGSFMVTGIELRRMTGGVMIEDGAIKASKLDTSDLSVAGLAIFGGSLQNPDFVAGQDGWQLKEDGSAELNSLIVRESMIAPNAVSKVYRGAAISGNLSDLAPNYSEVTGCSFSAPVISGSKIKNPVRYKVSGTIRPQTSGTNTKVRFTFERRTNGAASWVSVGFSRTVELPSSFYRFYHAFSLENDSPDDSTIGDLAFHTFTQYRVKVELIVLTGTSGYPSFGTTIAEQDAISLTMEQINK